MATAEQTEAREKAREERMQREKEAREKQEKEEQQAREEGRKRANEFAEDAMEDAEKPDAATTYESVRLLTIIAENRHADANHALIAIAKCVLGMIGKTLKQDPIHHLHGRNIVPGKKSDVPVRIGPEPMGETESTTQVRVQEDRKREHEEAVASMEDESRRNRERADAADPSKPGRPDDAPDKPGQPDEPGRPEDPGRPDDTPGNRPDLPPPTNPTPESNPARRASDVR